MIHDLAVQEGFTVCYPTIKRIIHQWNRTHPNRKVFILQEPEPGRAEFDWAETRLEIDGV